MNQTYEFWEIDKEHLDRLYRRLYKTDLSRIIQELAKEIYSGLKDKPSPCWVDVGSGDWSTIESILSHIGNLDRINLSCIEPSELAVSQLEKRLVTNEKLNLTIQNREFLPNLIPRNSFDVMTLLHSVYYLGSTQKDYQRLFEKLLESLKNSGKIVSLSISSKGDFNKLGATNYIDISLGDNLYAFLKQNGYNPDLKELSTRYDVTDFINYPQRTSEELKFFYYFVNQNPNMKWDTGVEENFRKLIENLAVAQEGKLMLDFKDTLVVLEK